MSLADRSFDLDGNCASLFRVHAKCVGEEAPFIAVFVGLPVISGSLLDLPISRFASEGRGCDMTRADVGWTPGEHAFAHGCPMALPFGEKKWDVQKNERSSTLNPPTKLAPNPPQ